MPGSSALLSYSAIIVVVHVIRTPIALSMTRTAYVRSLKCNVFWALIIRVGSRAEAFVGSHTNPTTSHTVSFLGISICAHTYQSMEFSSHRYARFIRLLLVNL